MMNGPEKSDSAIVATKPTNKAEPSVERSAGEPYAAEPVERRAGTKGNAGQQSTRRTQSRESVSQALERIRKVARERNKEKFTALLHHVNIDLLEEAFFELKKNAAPGVDRLTWKDYEADLERNLKDLHARVQRGAYRALPSRRVYIPKPDGRQRPLAVAVLQEKATDLIDDRGPLPHQAVAHTVQRLEIELLVRFRRHTPRRRTFHDAPAMWRHAGTDLRQRGDRPATETLSLQ